MVLTVFSINYLQDDCLANTTLHCNNQSLSVAVTGSSPYDYNSFLDDIFDRNEEGRLCGAQACPIFLLGNSSLQSGFRVLPLESSKILIGVYSSACALAFVLSALGLDSIKTLVR